jgi:hypothetical protein
MKRFIASGLFVLPFLSVTAYARQEQPPTLILCKLGTNADDGRPLNLLLRMFTEDTGSGSYLVDSWDPQGLLESRQLLTFDVRQQPESDKLWLSFHSGDDEGSWVLLLTTRSPRDFQGPQNAIELLDANLGQLPGDKPRYGGFCTLSRTADGVTAFEELKSSEQTQ